LNLCFFSFCSYVPLCSINPGLISQGSSFRRVSIVFHCGNTLLQCSVLISEVSSFQRLAFHSGVNVLRTMKLDDSTTHKTNVQSANNASTPPQHASPLN
jgi:hypothetical protein